MLFKSVVLLCAVLSARACFLKDAKLKVICPVNEDHVLSWTNLLNGLKPVWKEDIQSSVRQANEALKLELTNKITNVVHKCEDVFDNWKQQQETSIHHDLEQNSATLTKLALDIASVVAKNRDLERANNKLSSSVTELTQIVNKLKQRELQIKEKNDELAQKVDQLVLIMAQWKDPMEILRREQQEQRDKDLKMKRELQGL